jgi:hypothetical protein
MVNAFSGFIPSNFSSFSRNRLSRPHDAVAGQAALMTIRITALAARIKKLLHRLTAADDSRHGPVPRLRKWRQRNVVAIFLKQCYVNNNKPNDGHDGRLFLAPKSFALQAANSSSAGPRP